MAYKAVITREAQREYEAIVSYLATALLSPAAANDFMNEFDYQVALTCEMSLMHPLSHLPELAALGYRPIHIHQTQDYARLI